jgi:glycosyltransferase involved in cell wall biosynthesis
MSFYGGIESYIYNLSKNLVKLGHKVTVVTSKMPKTLPKTENIEGIEIIRLNPPAIVGGFPIMPNLPFKLLSVSKDADIIHGHINAPAIIESATLASKIIDVPLVVTYHADPIIQDVSVKIPNCLQKVLRNYWISVALILKSAKTIIATTPLYIEKSEFLRNYLEKVVVIPNSIDFAFFREPNPQDIQIFKKNYRLENNRILLFVGRLVKYKGIEYLLKAMKTVLRTVGNVRLLIVGDGPLRGELEYLTRKMNLEKYVIFVGNVNSELLRNIYALADLFVLPSISKSEGFGIVLIEAMTYAKPIIASNVGGIPYVVNNGLTGVLVTPRNSEELGNRIIELLSDTGKAQNLGKKGQEYVRKHYSWEHTIKQLVEVYIESIEN